MEVRCGEMSMWTNNPPMRTCLYQRIKDPRKTVIDNYDMDLTVVEVHKELDCQIVMHANYPPPLPG